MKFLLALLLSLLVVNCSNSEFARPIEQTSSLPEEEPIIDEDTATTVIDTPAVIEIEGMVHFDGGLTTIGSKDKNFKPNERPAMKVQLDYDFYMGIHEVTCGEYASVAKKAKLKTFQKCENDSIPLADITYYDAILYANAKSKLDGYDTAYTYNKSFFDNDGHCTTLEGFAFRPDVKAFRLPTEAEWVYAATRAWDIKKSWNNSNSEYKLHPVCSKGADSIGLCDMAGNAMEWVNDWMSVLRDTTVTNYAGAPDAGDMGERVVKGGCYSSSEKEINPYSRGDVYTVTSATRAEYVGFRLAFGNIPNALWIGSNGKSQTSLIILLAGNETIKQIAGSYNVKLVFRNDISGNIAYIDYVNGGLSATEITSDINAYHPEISPNGKWVAYCTGFEGVSKKSTIYVQSLEDTSSSPIKLKAESAVIPRWRVLGNGDTNIVYVTDAGNNKDEATFKSAETWQVSFTNGKFGTPQKLFNGAYHGGISEDNTLAVSGARLLRARIAEEGSTITENAHDTIWYDQAQACNASLAQDGSKRTAFLDFSGNPGKKFVGGTYTTHERIFIADSTGKLIQSIKSPSGYTFDHSEWATDGKNSIIAATLTNLNGAHTKIALVNPTDSSITEIVEGEELWHPNLWVKKKAVKTRSSSSTVYSSASSSSSALNSGSSSADSITSTGDESNSSSSTSSSSSEIEILPDPDFELDLDSAGLYYNTSGAFNDAIVWRYKMEFLWNYKDTANVVVIGNSRVHYGINPLVFTPPIFGMNLAVSAHPHKGSYEFLINYVLPHVKNLKVVIMSIDLDLWYYVSTGIFASAYKSYSGYVYDKNHNYWKNNYPEGLAEATYDSPGQANVQNSLRPTRGFNPRNAGGWGEPSTKFDSTWYENPDEDYKLNYRQNFNYLVQMIEACQEKNITFIGVITPQNPRYKETGSFGKFGIRRSVAPTLIEEIASLSNTYPNFVLMDENKMGDHDYTDDMAYDRDHLATKGAEQLSSRIDALIHTLNIDFTP